MGRTGTNNGGGPRWGTMPRATCPKCGLNKPVGVTQSDSNFVCRNTDKCAARALKRHNANLEQRACTSG